MSEKTFASAKASATVRRHDSTRLNSRVRVSWQGTLLASLGIAAFSGAAAEVPAVPTQPTAEAAATPKPAQDTFKDIWKRANLYKNDENPVIQSFTFTGRFQLDYAVIDADQGHHDEWNIRRFRLGGKAKVFHDFTLHAEVEIDPQDGEPDIYQRMTDLYVSWSRDPKFKITAGKHSAPFTMDGWTSSKELIAIDRSNLANNLWFSEEYIPGVSVDGQLGKWLYHVGGYSSGAKDPEFGEFNGGYFGLATIGYNFAEALDVKEAILRADYVYNEPDRHNSFTRSLQHVASLNFSLDAGKWGVRTDLSAAEGFGGQSDLWGAMLMPFYNITDKLQLVGRYTYVDSKDADGVRLARYENEVVTARGDEYHEVYLGLNYYVYGHKLKLQTGVQYADMQDRNDGRGEYSGWGWTSGLRVSW
jgi:phosphate-selective porin OprO and OprP